MQCCNGRLGAIPVLCVLLGCRSLPGAPALPALLWDVAPEAGLWLPALQRSCSGAASCPWLQLWSYGELDFVSGEDGHHVHPSSRQRGQGTRNIRSHSLGTTVVVGIHQVRLGRGVCYWGPASQECIACRAAFLVIQPC